MKVSTCVYLQKNDRVLMLLRNKKEHDVNHGKYIGVGGKLEKGETVRQCAVREVYEETGYIVDDLDYRGIVHFLYDEDEEEKIYIYTSASFHGEEIPCNEGTLSWVNESDIMNLNLWEGDRIFLERMSLTKDVFSFTLLYDSNGILKEVQENEAETE